MGSFSQVKQKLVRVLGHLATRSIQEARKVPYVVEQDSIVEILIRNPALYKQMVLDGEIEPSGANQQSAVAKVDILADLQEFRALDQYDMSVSALLENSSSHERIFAQVNLLTKLFIAYSSNLLTVFEREYEQFRLRFLAACQTNEAAYGTVTLDAPDMIWLEDEAKRNLAEGRFVEAFSLGRLIRPDVLKDDLIRFSDPDYSLTREILSATAQNRDLLARTLRFSIRVSYISQHSWQDLLVSLRDLVLQTPSLCDWKSLVDAAEADFVFCCNLLHERWETLAQWSDRHRRALLENCLRNLKAEI
ncbi:MAG: hypothetical protein AB1898_12500 [Acidobacteriota bacterium]